MEPALPATGSLRYCSVSLVGEESSPALLRCQRVLWGRLSEEAGDKQDPVPAHQGGKAGKGKNQSKKKSSSHHAMQDSGDTSCPCADSEARATRASPPRPGLVSRWTVMAQPPLTPKTLTMQGVRSVEQEHSTHWTLRLVRAQHSPTRATEPTDRPRCPHAAPACSQVTFQVVSQVCACHPTRRLDSSLHSRAHHPSPTVPRGRLPAAAGKRGAPSVRYTPQAQARS